VAIVVEPVDTLRSVGKGPFHPPANCTTPPPIAIADQELHGGVRNSDRIACPVAGAVVDYEGRGPRQYALLLDYPQGSQGDYFPIVRGNENDVGSNYRMISIARGGRCWLLVDRAHVECVSEDMRAPGFALRLAARHNEKLTPTAGTPRCEQAARLGADAGAEGGQRERNYPGAEELR
jgi:hypothetical protein